MANNIIRQAMILGQKKLASYSPTAHLDSRILMAKALSFTTEELLVNIDQSISTDQLKHFESLIQRRARNEPIAYIVGEQEFYGLSFEVNPSVLIPRPETEQIIDYILQKYNHSEKLSILDLGTGSGIIAITLAKNLSNIEKIIATDISDKALKVALNNAVKHEVSDDIIFTNSDWYSSLVADKFDIIISNPPYICYSEKDVMAPETRLYEPESALYAPENGYKHYYSIIQGAKDYLRPGGELIVEIGYQQGEKIKQILDQYQFKNCNIIKDYAGHDRIISAK